MTEVQRLAAESGDESVEFAQDESHLFFPVRRTPAHFAQN